MNLQLLQSPLLSCLSTLVFAPATASAHALPLLTSNATAPQPSVSLSAPATAPASSSPHICNAGPALMPAGKLQSYHQAMAFWPGSQQVGWSLPSMVSTISDTCIA